MKIFGSKKNSVVRLTNRIHEMEERITDIEDMTEERSEEHTSELQSQR